MNKARCFFGIFFKAAPSDDNEIKRRSTKLADRLLDIYAITKNQKTN
jgi:hypothetical protein